MLTDLTLSNSMDCAHRRRSLFINSPQRNVAMSILSFVLQRSPIYPLLTLTLLIISAAHSSHAASYTINPAGTHVRFAIERFQSPATAGGFYNVQGQLQYDSSLKTGNISLVIPIRSLNTGNKAFNQTLTGYQASLICSAFHWHVLILTNGILAKTNHAQWSQK